MVSVKPKTNERILCQVVYLRGRELRFSPSDKCGTVLRIDDLLAPRGDLPTIHNMKNTVMNPEIIGWEAAWLLSRCATSPASSILFERCYYVSQLGYSQIMTSK